MHRGDDIMNPIHQGLEGPSDVTKDEGDNEPLISKLEFDEEISLEGVPASFYTDGPDSNANIPVLGILLHRHGKVSDAEMTTNEQPQCRICLDIGGDDLIAPCQCRGTQKYVHRTCLDIWRAAKEGFAFAHCSECRALFRLRANVPADRWWLRLKFQLLVLRDHTAIFIVVQLVVASFSFLVYSLYGDELKEMFGFEDHHLGFYALAVTVMLMVGLLYGFFIAILCGQKISNRHYHVLAKQELTKEYVVQNINDDEPPPVLDSGHISELRMLGLY